MSGEKSWGGRFGAEGGREAEAFTASLPVDKRLWAEDLAGSRAHARMLGRQGILTPEETAAILRGLDRVEEEIRLGTFPFRLEHEDIHLNVERRLIELVGPVGGKLHTARSRNDQVALDEHLFLQRAVRETDAGLVRLMQVLLDRAEEAGDLLIPGYTHLQRAQPTLLAHHLLAYVFMLERDRERLQEVGRRYRRSPLGAAALAGTSHPIDPLSVAQELGLERLYDNSLDATSSRDHVLEYLFTGAMVMQHLSRLAEEIVLWSSQEFGFVELSDAYCTGSSIMPQKKNPDVAELIRGKTGRVYGHLMAMLTVVKGLPLGYASDLQEDKEALFDTHDTLQACLAMAAGMLATATFRAERLRQAVQEDFSTATDLADHLVRKGVPFREAHRVVGQLVARLLEEGRQLQDLTPEELAAWHPGLADARPWLDPAFSAAARTSPGGTAPVRVAEQLRMARQRLAQTLPPSHGSGASRD